MPYLIQGIVLGFSAAGSPGPFQAYLLGRALRSGWRRTWPAAFAPLLSDGPVVALVLLLLSQVPAWFVTGLRAIGGLFLLYLSWGAFRALRRPTSAQPELDKTGKGIAQAALMNLLSPGPWLFWSTVAGPVFLRGWQESPVAGLSFVGGFYAVMVGQLLVLIAVFSAAGRLGPRVVKGLQIAAALALVGFALFQLAAAFREGAALLNG
jgi:threonine/homoserine/homoserine lactone efflux protein